MAHPDIKSKRYPGVYYRVLDDGSKTYCIPYKDPLTGKSKRTKIGTSKEGINEPYCHNLRMEILSKLRLGEDTKIPIVEKKQKRTALNELADHYFKVKLSEQPGRSTKDRRSKYQKHYADGIGALSIATVTRRDVDRLKRDLVD